MKTKLKLKDGIQVISLAGYKGSGKDTLGNHLVDHINSMGEREAIRIGLADALKTYCHEAYLLDMDIMMADQHTKDTTLTKLLWADMPQEVKDKYNNSKSDTIYMTYREAMQIIGTDLGREKHGEDIWLQHLTDKINCVENEKPLTVVVTDVRFDNEAQWCMDNGGHVVKIVSNIKNKDVHVSELPVSRYNYEIMGKGKSSLAASKTDIETLYGYMELHERVRNFTEEK